MTHVQVAVEIRVLMGEKIFASCESCARAHTHTHRVGPFSDS